MQTRILNDSKLRKLVGVYHAPVSVSVFSCLCLLLCGISHLSSKCPQTWKRRIPSFPSSVFPCLSPHLDFSPSLASIHRHLASPFLPCLFIVYVTCCFLVLFIFYVFSFPNFHACKYFFVLFCFMYINLFNPVSV